jgi:type IV fimbrial biogenesis protein FimT
MGPAPRTRIGRHALGFTLVELLSVVAIAAILTAAAVPSFNRFMISARVSEAESALRGAIELARSEAVVRSTRVGVCRSASANAAAPACSAGAAGGFGGNDWAVGWLVYAKAAANAGDALEANDVVIRRQGALSDRPAGPRVMIWAPAGNPMVFGWNGVRAAGPVGSFAVDFGPATASAPATLVSGLASCLGVNVAGRVDAARPVSGACP